MLPQEIFQPLRLFLVASEHSDEEKACQQYQGLWGL